MSDNCIDDILYFYKNNISKYDHTYEYILNVKNISIKLCEELKICDIQRRYVLIVTILHRFFKYKRYCGDLVNDMLSIFFDKTTIGYLFDCIEMISFTKERDIGMKYYEQKLPLIWVFIRNIASDAVKSLMIGHVGDKNLVKHSIKIISSASDYKNHNLDTTVSKYVARYTKDNLLSLPSYARTSAGKELIQQKYIEFINELNANNIWNYMDSN